jgi:hypothetical protein
MLLRNTTRQMCCCPTSTPFHKGRGDCHSRKFINMRAIWLLPVGNLSRRSIINHVSTTENVRRNALHFTEHAQVKCHKPGKLSDLEHADLVHTIRAWEKKNETQRLRSTLRDFAGAGSELLSRQLGTCRREKFRARPTLASRRRADLRLGRYVDVFEKQREDAKG